MAVPATNAELAAALRIAADDPRLTTLSPALSDWLDTRINNSPVPATVKKEAFIRLVAYIYDMPESAGSMGWARPFVNSGAAALLSDYLIQGAAILSADAAAALSVASIAGHYVTAVAIDGSTLVITFSNAQEVRLALPQPPSSTVADGSIGVDELSAGVVLTLNKSVPFDGVSLSGATLTFASSDGQRTDITLPSTSGGGLDQAAVDARVDALVPPARRVPAYAVGDAGEVLTVATDGNSLRFSPPLAMPDDANTELSVLTAIPAVAGYAIGDIVNVNGELYELVAGGDAQNEISGLNAGAPSGYTGSTVFQWDETSKNIRLYIPQTWITTPAPAILYATVNDDKGLHSFTTLARSSGDDGTNPATYAYHRKSTPPEGAGLVEIPGVKHWWIRLYEDSANIRPFNLTGRNQSHFEIDRRNQLNAEEVKTLMAPEAVRGTTLRWQKSKLPIDTLYINRVAPQALAGNTTPWPPSKTDATVIGTRLLDHEFPGLTLARTDLNVRPAAPTALAPAFDLDTAGNSRGEFHCALTLTIAPVSDVNMAFVKTVNATAEQRTVNLSNILFASDLAGEDAFVFSALSALSGLVAFEQQVFSNQTDVGTYRFLLVRDANNVVSTYHYWDGQAGGTGATLTAEARITFTPTDAPTGNTGGGLVIETVKDWTAKNTLPTDAEVLKLIAADVKWIIVSVRNNLGHYQSPGWIRPQGNNIVSQGYPLNIATNLSQAPHNEDHVGFLLNPAGTSGQRCTPIFHGPSHLLGTFEYKLEVVK